MKYLPDTNAWIEAINNPAGIVATRSATHSASEIAFNSISHGELLTGAFKSPSSALEILVIDQVVRQFLSLGFDNPAAEDYAKVRSHLERIGQRIGAYDMQIAGIALQHNLTVVTHNVREFSRVPGLVIEDWQVP
jgi:tRNA(fMet)-specific endonuclease VapC